MDSTLTEREARFQAMINDLLISLDRIAVSKGMGSSRAEAIRAVEGFEVNWRRFKKDFFWEETKNPFDGDPTAIYGSRGVRLDNGPIDK